MLLARDKDRLIGLYRGKGGGGGVLSLRVNH